MSMGRRREKQQPLWMAAGELPKSPGHRFYEKLNELLREADFDRKVEALCRSFYESDDKAGRPSIAPGVYFRMLFIGYFEGIESERGLEWRCSDSLSLREFLGLVAQERVPDHSALSRIRTRLSGAVYDEVFRLVLGIVQDKGLLKGKVVGVDSTFLRADAAMKAIVRKDTGDGYQDYLKNLCKAQGIENPTADDCRRVDRKRKGKRTSNKDWKSKTDPDARIMKLKDGRTRLAHKAEHVVDMETGAVLAVGLHAADHGDTSTLQPSLEQARTNLATVESKNLAEPTVGSDVIEDGADAKSAAARPRHQAKSTRGSDDDLPPTPPVTPRPVIEVVADKGYHKAELLRDLKNEQYRTYISVPKKTGTSRWTDKGGIYTEQAYYGNRTRVGRAKGRALMRRRGELIERTFAHICETGGHRRARLRGRDNIRKRYLMQVAGMNLGLVLRMMLGQGTPRALAEARKGRLRLLWVLGAMVAAVVTVAVRTRSTLRRRPGALLGGWEVRPQLVAG
jgi:transposase